jgi:hypothetical protein
MKKHFKLIGFLAVFAMLLVPIGALADSIAPSTWTVVADPAALTVATIHKTVTVSTIPTVQTDIFFLSDTTGSMGGTIATVQANAAAILAATSGLGNTAWGVGEYKDGNVDAFGYLLNQAITTNQAAVVAGIGAWVASGGGDEPEDNLMGIRRAATDAASAWRAGSARIMVQFGDAPGLDPASDGTTLADATAALVGPPVTKLIAANVGAGRKDITGQETAMITALNAVSSGSVLLNAPDNDTLVAAVLAAIEESFATYHTVALEIAGLPDGITPFFTTSPASYTGDFDRSEDRLFDFDVTLVGCCAAFGKDFDFVINALVDGAIVATEFDHWTCVPLPPSVFLLGTGLLALIPLRRRMKRT